MLIPRFSVLLWIEDKLLRSHVAGTFSEDIFPAIMLDTVQESANPTTDPKEILGQKSYNLIITDHTQVDDGLRKLLEHLPDETAFVMIGQEPSLNAYKELIAAGVTEYIQIDEFETELLDIIEQLYSERGSGKIGQVCTFQSLSHGAGSSTLALLTAISLASTYGQKTIYLDIDIAKTFSKVYLNDKGTGYFDDLISGRVTISDRDILQATIKMNENLDILTPRDRLNVDVNTMTTDFYDIIEVLKQNYEYVIVDAPIFPTDKLRQMVNISDKMLPVMTLTPQGYYGLDWFLQESPEKSNYIFILNKYERSQRNRIRPFEKKIGNSPLTFFKNMKAEIDRLTLDDFKTAPGRKLARQIDQISKVIYGGSNNDDT